MRFSIDRMKILKDETGEPFVVRETVSDCFNPKFLPYLDILRADEKIIGLIVNINGEAFNIGRDK